MKNMESNGQEYYDRINNLALEILNLRCEYGLSIKNVVDEVDTVMLKHLKAGRTEEDSL